MVQHNDYHQLTYKSKNMIYFTLILVYRPRYEDFEKKIAGSQSKKSMDAVQCFIYMFLVIIIYNNLHSQS